jgi:hypothetical protein
MEQHVARDKICVHVIKKFNLIIVFECICETHNKLNFPTTMERICSQSMFHIHLDEEEDVEIEDQLQLHVSNQHMIIQDEKEYPT